MDGLGESALTARGNLGGDLPLAGRVAGVLVEEDALAHAVMARLREGGALVDRLDHPARIVPFADATPFSRAVDALVGKYGRLDVWVQSAASADDALGDAADMLLEAFSGAMAGTLCAAFAGAQAVMRHMLPRGTGSLVFLTSVDGMLASRGRSSLSCGAAAVMMLSRSLACESASRGVRVNAIATTTWLAAPLGLDEVELTAAGISPTRIPMGRAARADEIAEAVYYLASPRSSFVTGEVLRVDGGWAAYHLF